MDAFSLFWMPLFKSKLSVVKTKSHFSLVVILVSNIIFEIILPKQTLSI